INGLLAVIATGSAVALAAGVHSQALFILGILVTAAILGNLVVLPIGGADMPVVISLLNAFTGLSAAATGIALDNTALIVAGTLVGASGSILTNLMAVAMNRSVPAIIAGGFGGGGTVAATAADDGDRSVRPTSADDVSLVIGANDVTNPAAREQKDSPIYGMPILDVDKSGQVIVLKRSMNTGFAGIDNPLFYLENTALLFGDAKASIQSVLAEVKEL